MISLSEYLMGRDKEFPLDMQQALNAADLLSRVNYLFGRLNLSGEVSSGYRPSAINKGIEGASKGSMHIHCRAIDIKDPFFKIGQTLLARVDLLESCGLWMEHPDYTKKIVDGKIIRWQHLDTKERKNRIFIPY